jgi:hypothetical protein
MGVDSTAYIEGNGANLIARLVAFAIWAFSASALAAEPSVNTEPSQLAQHAVDLAEASKTTDLASLFHYPSTYSQDERTEDTAGIADSLGFIFSEFGKPKNIQINTDPASYYEVGLFGGTLPYWEGLSPFETEQFVYSTTFANVGPGFLIIKVFKHQDAQAFEIQAFGIALPESSAAKAKVIDLMIRGLERDGIPLPAGFRKTLEAQLQPSTVGAKSHP